MVFRNTGFIIGCMLAFYMPTFLKAQDQQFTQFYNSMVYVNPATVGNESVPRASFGYRSQWASLAGNLTGFTGAVDTYFKKYNSGAGILFNSGQGGVGGLYSTDLMSIYSYRVKFKKDWSLNLGMQLGYVFRGGTYYQYVFGDQLYLDGDVKNSSQENLNQSKNINYFDTGAGFLLFKEGTQIGVSAYHFTRPNQSVNGGVDRLPMKISATFSHRFILDYRATRTEEYYTSITPMIYYSWQGPYQQMSIGAMYDFTPFQIGLFYRGMPYLSQDGVINSDAIAPAVGVRYKGFVFGYSYDITISGLTNQSGGAHEIHLGYVVESLKPYKPKNRFKKKK